MKKQKQVAIILIMSLLFSMVMPYLDVLAESNNSIVAEEEEVDNSLEVPENVIEEEQVLIEEDIDVNHEEKSEKIIESTPIKKNVQRSGGRDLSKTGFINNITPSKTDVIGGEIITIKADYSEKRDNKIKNGDYFILDLGEDFTANRGTIDLKGKGTCETSSDKVICTFNESVEDGINNNGHIEFTVYVKHINEQVEELTTNLQTDAPMFNLTINKGQSGISPFEYKSGYYTDLETEDKTILQ